MLVMLINRHEDSLFSKINDVCIIDQARTREKIVQNEIPRLCDEVVPKHFKLRKNIPQPYACHCVYTLHGDIQFSKIIVASRE